VVVGADIRRHRSGSAFPVLLDVVHEIAYLEHRKGQFEGIRGGTESVLEFAQHVFDVEREPTESRIARVAELVQPAEFVRDDGAVGQVGVEDGAALETVGQRVADDDQPVPRRLCPVGAELHLDAERRIGGRGPGFRAGALLHLVRRVVRYLCCSDVGHRAPRAALRDPDPQVMFPVRRRPRNRKPPPDSADQLSRRG